ncbi:SMC domain protein [Candidatus Moduliflexus flocculans]|uniref:SMC domain protein n=1 Tax=Candidatus Moduliflexus flocculans TaxID=1499966 RepID=A0A0S6W4T4_9BACT|nr:SMC domain protein [Candidatus Moduliflexus flocculans]
MAIQLKSLHIRNFRSLADITIKTDALNVLFGPNGAGKSTFLDTSWLVRDCITTGVDQASTDRSHGIGMRWILAEDGANIAITLETELAEYEVVFGYSSGRIEPFVGEMLHDKTLNIRLIDRKIGSDKAFFYHTNLTQYLEVPLRDPEKLALGRYLDFLENPPRSASEMNQILQSLHFYPSRKFDFFRLKNIGSESNYHTWLSERCQNLWSVLRNLAGKGSLDGRYDTILSFMQKTFPDFDELIFDQTGPSSVYASFREKGLREPIQASGVSDGHLQMLILLTALFSEGKNRHSMILFDEPETSLHPHALAVFAEAVELAVKEWDKQIFIATHSPVLISQFDPANILAFERDETRQTVVRRVSEIENIQDLLEQYATGSLYMAELIAAQSKPVWKEKGFWEEKDHAPEQ